MAPPLLLFELVFKERSTVLPIILISSKALRVIEPPGAVNNPPSKVILLASKAIDCSSFTAKPEGKAKSEPSDATERLIISPESARKFNPIGALIVRIGD